MVQNLFYDYILLEKGLSKNTLDAYRRDVEQFFAHFGTFVVSEDDVRDYLYSASFSATTLARKISTLKNLYKFLLSNNYVEFSPFESIGGVKLNKRLPSYLTVEEIRSIAASFPNDYKGVRDKMIFDILVYTGSRISEIIGLRISDVDLRGKMMKIKGKGEKIRLVPINEYLVEKIANYIDNFRSIFLSNLRDDKLFPKISRNNFWHRLKLYAAKSGVKKPVHPHMLRHSFATSMLNNGANIRHVQEILGHSSVSTTEIYTHVQKEKLKRVHEEVFKNV